MQSPGSLRTPVLILSLLIGWNNHILLAQSQAQSPSALLAQSLTAMLSSNTSIQDISLQGTVEYFSGSTDVTGTISLQAMADGSSRIDISVSGGIESEIVLLNNNKVNGYQLSANGSKTSLPLHNMLTFPTWFSPALLLQHANAAPQTITTTQLTPTDTEENYTQTFSFSSPCSSNHAITCNELKRLSQIQVLFGSNSLFPLCIRYSSHSTVNSRRNIPVEIRYDDYQIVNGISVPLHIQKYFNGVLALDMRLSSVLVNTNLSQSQLDQ